MLGGCVVLGEAEPVGEASVSVGVGDGVGMAVRLASADEVGSSVWVGLEVGLALWVASSVWVGWEVGGALWVASSVRVGSDVGGALLVASGRLGEETGGVGDEIVRVGEGRVTDGGAVMSAVRSGGAVGRVTSAPCPQPDIRMAPRRAPATLRPACATRIGALSALRWATGAAVHQPNARTTLAAVVLRATDEGRSGSGALG